MEHKAYEAVKAQHERIIAINGDGAMPRDYGQNFNAIAQLLADYEALRSELETLRDERDALRNKLAEIMETAMWGTIGDYDPTLLDIEVMAADALNTQPQAEWTPRIDDKVRTAWSGAICTVVNTHDNRSLIVSESGIEGWINNSELTPVDESEA